MEDPLEQPFLLNVPNSNQPRGAQGDARLAESEAEKKAILRDLSRHIRKKEEKEEAEKTGPLWVALRDCELRKGKRDHQATVHLSHEGACLIRLDEPNSLQPHSLMVVSGGSMARTLQGPRPRSTMASEASMAVERIRSDYEKVHGSAFAEQQLPSLAKLDKAIRNMEKKTHEWKEQEGKHHDYNAWLDSLERRRKECHHVSSESKEQEHNRHDDEWLKLIKQRRRDWCTAENSLNEAFEKVHQELEEHEGPCPTSRRRLIRVRICGPTNLLQECSDALREKGRETKETGVDLVLDKQSPLHSWLSPLSKLSLPVEKLKEMGISPERARYYAFLYPCKLMSDTKLSSKKHLNALLLFGGFCYLDAQGLIVSFTVFSQEWKRSMLRFRKAPPRLHTSPAAFSLGPMDALP